MHDLIGKLDTREEWANTTTHALGILASLAAGAVLVVLACIYGNAWQIVCSAIYVTTLILLYTASTLYHAARDPHVRARLKVFDHCAIYLLIAGTYTPFMLVALRSSWGWSLFGVVWGLAVAGVVFKLYFTGRFKRMSTAIYIAMGWLALVVVGPMMQALPAWALLWLLAGGVAYTAGTFFYHNQRIRYSHAIWHLFVLGGSSCHFVAVWAAVLPAA